MRRHPTFWKPFLRPPTNLVVSQIAALPAGQSQLALTWNISEPLRISAVWRNGAFVYAGPVGTSAFTDTGLAAGTVYSYQVRHSTGGATPIVSKWSNTASAATQPATAGLNPPTNVVVSQIPQLPAGITQLALSWVNALATDQIRVWRNDGVTWVVAAELAPGTTTFTDTGLAANHSYLYILRHLRGGTESGDGPSNSGSATTQVAFNPPALTSVVASGSMHLTLTWTNAQAGDYIEVFGDGNYLTVLPPGTTAYRVGPVWFNSAHSFFLRHFRTTASGSYDTANSNTVSGTSAVPIWVNEVIGSTRTWNWPANVTYLYPECLGGGGAGGGAYGRPSWGGGGQGGGYAAKWIVKGAEAALSLTVGPGGVPDTYHGQPTFVTQNGVTVVNASGGNNGNRADTASGSGQGGYGDNTSGVGDVIYSGGVGGTSTGSPAYSGGGGGAAGPGGGGGTPPIGGGGAAGPGAWTDGGTYQGAGAIAVNTSGPGVSGNPYGGGAAGAAKSSLQDQAGANGYGGLMLLLYASNE